MKKIEINCPKCNTEIDVSEIIKNNNKDLYDQLEKQKKIEKENLSLRQQIEQSKIASKDREEKLKAQAKLEAEKNNTVELKKIKEQAKLEAEKDLQEKTDEINKQNEIINRRLKKDLESANRQLQSKPSELLGEVQEELIEDFIIKKFPKDDLEEIKRGKNGADSLLKILSPEHMVLGKILIESKNTKEFSNNWIPKILDDMESKEADVGIIISKALPADFPKDHYWNYYESGLIGLVGFKYQHVYALIEILKTKIIASKKNSNQISIASDLERIWKWITNPKFTTQYRKMYSQAEKMKNQLAKMEKEINKQTADQYKSIDAIQAIQREWLYDLIKSVGEEKLPQELIKYDDKKI